MDSSIVPTVILQSDGLLREGLRLMLERTRFCPQNCVAELDDLTRIPSDKPTLFIVEIRQKQVSICKRIRALYPLSFIVAVGDESEHKHLASALDDGANAVLFNSVTPQALLDSLHTVMSGELIVIDAHFRSEGRESFGKTKEEVEIIEEESSSSIQHATSWETRNEPADLRHLSAREIAILERIVQGDSNKHVARFFMIAEPTVKAHVKAIFRKIGAINRTQAAIWALSHRLFDDPGGIASHISVFLQPEAGEGPNDTSSALEMDGPPMSRRSRAGRVS